jgi:hypothetical protein
MFNNQISAFEYVSILISIILGLGITQILSSFSDLLYNYKKVKFYWPHSLWILFILFLHIQDWFITYQLKDKQVWHLAELMFVLLYPISLFTASKMLLPNNSSEENIEMKVFYKSQYPTIFFLASISVIISILFNVFLLDSNLFKQSILVVFLILLMVISFFKLDKDFLHKILALTIILGSIVSVIVEKDNWIIK